MSREKLGGKQADEQEPCGLGAYVRLTSVDLFGRSTVGQPTMFWKRRLFQKKTWVSTSFRFVMSRKSSESRPGEP